jgi:uncharacterized protein
MHRAVLDTNVVLAANSSRNPASPNVEIIRRWGNGEFTWLFSVDTLEEYAEKLIERGSSREAMESFVERLLEIGEPVEINFFHLHHYPVDADDTAFLLAALNGDASHLVTYDAHLHDVAVFYPEFITCQPLEFLADLRA